MVISTLSMFSEDYRLSSVSCKLCFDKGEGFCPLKDDRILLENWNYPMVLSLLHRIMLSGSSTHEKPNGQILLYIHRPKFLKTFTAVHQGTFREMIFVSILKVEEILIYCDKGLLRTNIRTLLKLRENSTEIKKFGDFTKD